MFESELKISKLIKIFFFKYSVRIAVHNDSKFFVHKRFSFNGNNSYTLTITKSFIFEGQYMIYSATYFLRNELQKNSLCSAALHLQNILFFFLIQGQPLVIWPKNDDKKGNYGLHCKWLNFHRARLNFASNYFFFQ